MCVILYISFAISISLECSQELHLLDYYFRNISRDKLKKMWWLSQPFFSLEKFNLNKDIVMLCYTSVNPSKWTACI